MLKKLMGLSALALLVAGAASAQITPTSGDPAPSSLIFTGEIVPYLVFTHVQNSVAMNLGNPGDIGIAVSGQTWVEANSNYFVRVSYTHGTDATTTFTDGDGHPASATLPTTFKSELQGKGVINGYPFNFASYIPLPSAGNPGETGIITMEPGYNSGVKTAINVTRNGLHDHFGAYTTSVTLNWTAW